MTTLILESEPTAVQIEITNQKLVVELADGRTLMVPLAWYPRLMHGTQKERQNWQLLGDGYAIEWVELDEHIGIEGLLAGRQSGESQRSFSRWLGSRQATSQLTDNFQIKIESANGDRPSAVSNSFIHLSQG